MEFAKLFPMEYRFMEIVWESSPISAGRLAMLAEGKLGWKRTTSYTVLSRLIERGYLFKEGKLVTPLLAKADVDRAELSEICKRCFGGDKDAMIAAVKALTEEKTETQEP